MGIEILTGIPRDFMQEVKTNLAVQYTRGAVLLELRRANGGVPVPRSTFYRWRSLAGVTEKHRNYYTQAELDEMIEICKFNLNYRRGVDHND